MTGFGSPEYWRQRQNALTRVWWEKWLPSLDSTTTLEQAIPSEESFVLLVRQFGIGSRHRLAAALEGQRVFVLAPPVMLGNWERVLLKAGADPQSMSIYRVANWNERNREVALHDRVLIVEAPVSDKTKTKERLAQVCYGRRTIVYAHFMLDSPGKPPRDTSTALKIVNHGKAPVPVVWEPPIEGDLGQRLFRAGLVDPKALAR